MHRQAWIIGFLLCWAVATSAIAFEPTLNVSMVSAGQDGPLQIIGFKPTEGLDKLALHIRSVASKATQDFWVEPLVRNLSGQVWHSTNGHAATTPGFGNVPPGAETWDSNTGALRLTTLKMAAKDLHSTCLRITPMVMAVDFADGTSWKANSSQEADAMARADRTSSAPACTDSPDANNYLEQLDAIGIKANVFDSYRSEEPRGSLSFSFACSLHRVNDMSVRAVCGSRNTN
jgi:hypothetical protein